MAGNKKNSRCEFFKYYVELCQFHCLNPSPTIKRAVKHTDLNLCGDRVRAEDWQLIIKALSRDLSLESIFLWSRYCRVNPAFLNEGFKRKALTVRNVPPFLEPKILSSLISSLARCFQNSKVLSCLKLHFLPLLTHDAKLLSETIGSCSSLQHLSLSHSCLGDEACSLLCMSLKACPNLKSLNLAGCSISSVGAFAIATLIKEHSSLSSNEIWSRTLRQMGEESPEKREGLRRITLNQNPMIGDLGIDHLAMSLLDDLSIRAIDLQDCGVTNVGGEIIKCVLKVNQTLQIVDVRYNDKLDCSIFDEILNMLASNSQDSLQRQWTKIDPFITSKDHNLERWSEYDQQHPLCRLNIGNQSQKSLEKFQNHNQCPSMRNKTLGITPDFETPLWPQKRVNLMEGSRNASEDFILIEKKTLLEISSTLQKINLFIRRLNLPQLISILREVKAQSEEYETWAANDCKVVKDIGTKCRSPDENWSDDNCEKASQNETCQRQQEKTPWSDDSCEKGKLNEIFKRQKDKKPWSDDNCEQGKLNEIFKRQPEKTPSLHSFSKKCSCCNNISSEEQFQSEHTPTLSIKAIKRLKSDSELSEDFTDLFKMLRKYSSATGYNIQNQNSPGIS